MISGPGLFSTVVVVGVQGDPQNEDWFNDDVHKNMRYRIIDLLIDGSPPPGAT